MKVVAVIPARFASSRFPGKPLALIARRPMIEWVYEGVVRSKLFSEVVVATDDIRIYNTVIAFGGRAVMTRPELPSGTDRVAAAVKGIKADWIMNVQGDEPLISTLILKKLIQRARTVKTPSIITAASKITDSKMMDDPDSVKVVTNSSGRALYFSRSPIPFLGRADKGFAVQPLKHVGIYLFHTDALRKFVKAKPSLLELTEKLEQLRAFELAIPIEVVESEYHPINVDRPDDIRKVETALRKKR
ncbi:MAG: 3-deoxy-manno-octulosonate cytidylyltransferase [Fibrobacteres bacterium]|nr:3-deoxy-manno-octulosonate cytidylyltransferase [Fibrobacterota bacterium]